MKTKLLLILGSLAVLLLVAGAWIVKERLDRPFSAADPAGLRAPDPIELLRADTADLRADLAALSTAFPEQLQVLHDALEASAARRESRFAGELEALRQQLAALQARAEQDAAAALSARKELEAAPAEGRENPAAAAAPAAAPGEEAAREQSLASHAAPPPAEPDRKSALAFKLPAQAFRFEGRQRLAVVPSLSRVGFDAKSTLHDFSGVTQRLAGELEVDLSKPDLEPSGWIEVEAASLDTGVTERDESMRKLLDTQAHPKLRFEWNGMLDPEVDIAGQSLRGTAAGTLTLAGKSRDVAMPVRVLVDASKRVRIEGSLAIQLSDFGLVPPSKLGVISVEDKLELWIALRARTLGPVGGAH